MRPLLLALLLACVGPSMDKQDCPPLAWWRAQPWQCGTDAECYNESIERLQAAGWPEECADEHL